MVFCKIWRKLSARRHNLMPIYLQHASYLVQASEALCKMTESTDHSEWRKYEKEVKACEIQGDALLTEFYEQLSENIITTIRRADLQTLAMNLDDFLDHINDSAKSILLYMPGKIDTQLKDLAQYLCAQAETVKKMMALMEDLKVNYPQIAVMCERITELEHVADDAFAEYIGHIFTHEENAMEVIKYKNIAEAFEGTTDSAKRVSDTVRKIILRYMD